MDKAGLATPLPVPESTRCQILSPQWSTWLPHSESSLSTLVIEIRASSGLLGRTTSVTGYHWALRIFWDFSMAVGGWLAGV